MLQLHYYPSDASMAAHLVLEEIGAPFELKLVDRARQEHKAAAYLRLNPNGLIPVLMDGELVLYETAAICLHLIDTYSQSGLAPPVATAARAHFYKWLVWLTNTLQATMTLYFYPERWADTAEAAAQVRASAETKIATLLDQIEAELARHGRPWLLGESFSAVDLYTLMLCRWTRGFARPARSLAQLGPYLQRVLARPAVQRVFEREALPQPWV